MLSRFSSPTAEHLARYLETQAPGLACFDADGTLWAGDVGDAFLLHLVETRVIPDVWGQYEQLVAREPAAAYAFAVRAMAGLAEREVALRAEAFFASFEGQVFPAMIGLVRGLLERGHSVWLVSGSNRWIIEAAARRLGLPSQVIAQEVLVRDGILTDIDREPTIFGPGKVRAIEERLGQRPALAAGNSWSDAEMLEHATELRLLVNPTRLVVGERDLASHGRALGWIVEG
jgi:HAD superfamily phosphoserine phosphatase-like hydrolase